MRKSRKRAAKSSSQITNKKPKLTDDVSFIGASIKVSEARSQWPHRYQSNQETAIVSVTLPDGTTEEKKLFQATCHYRKAVVDGVVFELLDHAYFKAPEGETHYAGTIVEMFETVNKESYACVRWCYRAKDTIIKDCCYVIDEKRVFYSDGKDDTPLSSIVSKVKVSKVGGNMSVAEKEKLINSSELYFDMAYSFPHAFTSLSTEKDNKTASVGDGVVQRKSTDDAKSAKDLKQSKQTTLLDLYSGCGAMSSGLGIGALLGGENVVTRWAVDFNSYACDSLRHNHPNTEVRNEDAESFLLLLKEWETLCEEFNIEQSKEVDSEQNKTHTDDFESNDDGTSDLSAEYEVEKLVAIRYGDPMNIKKRGLHFKVRWKGYDSDGDTWEPIDGLRNCGGKIREFVERGYESRMLPLPGDVDVICGGPPCQGISGLNRFRETDDPLEDKRNRQLLIFMNIVDFLRPRFVLMENVTDILNFAGGQLARFAVGRLVSMNYQARLGIMAAGAYGVPQCRMRFFLWGAGPTEILPQFPLPTHEVMRKGVVLNEYKDLIVGHLNEENELDKTVLLGDAISDLPKISNYADQDEMPYGSSPRTTFQKFIRLKRDDIFGYQENDPRKHMLYDHRPLKLNEDDLERVCLIPKQKGANFRNLPGVIIGSDNVAKIDPSVGRLCCKSGKPLVPEYALKFQKGKSTKPFGRLSKDDVVATMVTRAEPWSKAILHWDQDRVLSVREAARLQGFPDCYRFFGPPKKRYMQIGNAVSFSVSIPLGCCLAEAIKGNISATPLSLPFKFPNCFGQLKPIRQNLKKMTRHR